MKNGYYWVKLRDGWTIAEWNDGYWVLLGSDELYTELVNAIIGKEIIYPYENEDESKRIKNRESCNT